MEKRNFFYRLFTAFILLSVFQPLNQTALAQTWNTNWDSITKHETPDWFNDAKFGIFIHWGVYSVPAWAPVGMYAEWYPNYMYQEGHAVYDYHRETYG